MRGRNTTVSERLAQHSVQILEARRLGQVTIHPSGVARIAVHSQGIGGQGDHRHSTEAASRFFASPSTGRGQAIHARQLEIHEHRSKSRATQLLDACLRTGHQFDIQTQLTELANSDPLIDRIVLHQQHPSLQAAKSGERNGS